MRASLFTCLLLAPSVFAGDLHQATRATLLEDARFTREAVLDRIQQLRFSFREGESEDGQQPYWARTYASQGSADGPGAAPSRERTVSGIALGSERWVGDWVLGATAGLSRTELEAGSDDARLDGYQLGAYLGTKFYNQIGFKTGLLLDSHRVDGHASAADAWGGQLFGELSYSLDYRDFSLEGFSELAWLRQDSERQADVGSQRDELLQATFGLRGTTAWTLGLDQRLVARVIPAWRRNSGDRQLGDEDGAGEAQLARDVIHLGLMLDWQLDQALSLGMAYEGDWATESRDNGLALRMSLKY